MKKTILALMAAAAFAPALAMAEAGDFVVRLRATYVAPDESSKLGSQTDATYGAGTAAALYGAGGSAAKLQVDDNTIPELDISYYITKNIAAELILALGTSHDVKINTLGTGAAVTATGLGSVNLLPPTLTLQWHFLPDQTFDPYAGAGVTYVRALDRNLTARTTVGDRFIHVERNSWGAALQAGFDVNLQDKWLVNFDVKKLWFSTDVTLDTQGALGTASGFRKIDSLDIDPWVISVGFGKKF
ncbi:MAG: OmpW family protein [Nitrosomonadales bacterium]|nr:MAG: OmpW family protein [Nitrosomonadales bacterium]